MASLTPITACPECGAGLTLKDINFKRPFPCPACNVELWVPDTYENKLIGTSALVVALGLLLIGVRLGVVFVILWIVSTSFFYFVLLLYGLYAMPGAIERHYRGLLE